MNKSIKTFLIILSMSISSLIMPVFGQWYFEQTGIYPIAFYVIGGIGYIVFGIIAIINIWE